MNKHLLAIITLLFVNTSFGMRCHPRGGKSTEWKPLQIGNTPDIVLTQGQAPLPSVPTTQTPLYASIDSATLYSLTTFVNTHAPSIKAAAEAIIIGPVEKQRALECEIIFKQLFPTTPWKYLIAIYPTLSPNDKDQLKHIIHRYNDLFENVRIIHATYPLYNAE